MYTINQNSKYIQSLCCQASQSNLKLHKFYINRCHSKYGNVYFNVIFNIFNI
jgi:hypothetical protein